MEKMHECFCERKSDACLSIEVSPELTNRMCYGCGFISNSFMKEDQEFYKSQYLILPELYKDLIWTDSEEFKWMPVTINEKNKGMIFMDGSNKESAKWAAVLAIPIPEEDQHKYPIPGKENEFYTHKTDMSTIKHFDRYDFIEALSYIGII